MTWDSEKSAYRANRQQGRPQVDTQDEAVSMVRQSRQQAKQQDRVVTVEAPELERVPVQFGPFTGGLVSNAGTVLRQDECSEMTNWTILPNGDIASRRGVTRRVFLDYIVGECRQILSAYVPFGAYTWRTIIADDEGYVYSLEDGDDYLIPICKLDAQCHCVSFANKLAVLASDYIRYWDGSWSATGPEMVTNGDMSVPGSWTYPAQWTVAGNVGTYDGSAVSGNIKQNITAVAGSIYKISYTVTNWALQTLSSTNMHRPLIGGVNYYCMGQESSGNGTFTFYIIAGTTDTWLYITGDSGYSFDVDDISVIEVDALPIAYDDGLGPSGNMYWTSGVEFWYGTKIDNTRQAIARTFTTVAWGDGGVTPTRITASLKAVGSPTGDVEGHIYDSTGVLVASGYMAASENLTTDYQEFVCFLDTINYTLLESSKYYICVVYTTGNASNYIDVMYEDYGEYGNGGGALITTIPGAGGWVVASEYTGSTGSRMPSISLSPGMPPQLSFGIVNNTRLFGIEGEDGENPSRLWYSGAGNLFDWSSPGIAGYDDLGDPIGCLSSMYKNLWIWGVKESPFLLRQTGDTPADWIYPMFVSWAYGYPWSVVDTPSSAYFVMRTGVYSLDAVETYKDIQLSRHAPGMADAITEGWEGLDDADRTRYVIGYDPSENVVILKPNVNSEKSYVVYLNAFSSITAGSSQINYHPGGEWSFFAGNITPVCFGSSGAKLWIGDSAGGISELNKLTSEDIYSDEVTNTVVPTLSTARFSTRFGEYRAMATSPNYYSEYTEFDVDFYVNFSESLWASKSIAPNYQPSNWITATAYVINDVEFARNGNRYTCTADHTSSTSNEPGLGEVWSDYWELSAEYFKDRAFPTFLFRNLMLGISGIGGLSNERIRIRDIIVLCQNLGGF